MIAGGRRALVDLARLVVAAEATGIANECTEQAAAYAKVRVQFGRPIATFQAVKHHCANMLVASELATGAVWDAARAATEGDDQFTYAAAIAAALALAAGDECAQLNTQVHGGIGITWEHDAHLYLRRATALEAFVDGEGGRPCDHRPGPGRARRTRTIDLPPEAEPMRDEVRAFAERVHGLDAAAQRDAMIETGYVMPHWPQPWGRNAGAVEQLVIEQEFAAAGVQRPQYSITGWVILTLIQNATEDQVERWVLPALRQDVIWCQLFSEPEAGSDAAGVKTRGTRVDGGWLVNGQKVWTSGAHYASFGLATIRTDPDAPKHEGITTMVIDMHAEGVEVRPLRMTTGQSEFNEVFFNDVFVPDDDVVGPVNGGWTVARATLGNESVSIGGGQGGQSTPAGAVIGPFDAHPERLPGGAGRIGRYIAQTEAVTLLNMRTAHRAAHRWRARARGQRHQAGPVGDRPRGGGDHWSRSVDPGPCSATAPAPWCRAWCSCTEACRSPAAPPRSSATRSVSAFSDCRGTRSSTETAARGTLGSVSSRLDRVVEGARQPFDAQRGPLRRHLPQTRRDVRIRGVPARSGGPRRLDARRLLLGPGVRRRAGSSRRGRDARALARRGPRRGQLTTSALTVAPSHVLAPARRSSRAIASRSTRTGAQSASGRPRARSGRGSGPCGRGRSR